MLPIRGRFNQWYKRQTVSIGDQFIRVFGRRFSNTHMYLARPTVSGWWTVRGGASRKTQLTRRCTARLWLPTEYTFQSGLKVSGQLMARPEDNVLVFEGQLEDPLDLKGPAGFYYQKSATVEIRWHLPRVGGDRLSVRTIVWLDEQEGQTKHFLEMEETFLATQLPPSPRSLSEWPELENIIKDCRRRAFNRWFFKQVKKSKIPKEEDFRKRMRKMNAADSGIFGEEDEGPECRWERAPPCVVGDGTVGSVSAKGATDSSLTSETAKGFSRKDTKDASMESQSLDSDSDSSFRHQLLHGVARRETKYIGSDNILPEFLLYTDRNWRKEDITTTLNPNRIEELLYGSAFRTAMRQHVDPTVLLLSNMDTHVDTWAFQRPCYCWPVKETAAKTGSYAAAVAMEIMAADCPEHGHCNMCELARLDCICLKWLMQHKCRHCYRSAAECSCIIMRSCRALCVPPP